MGHKCNFPQHSPLSEIESQTKLCYTFSVGNDVVNVAESIVKNGFATVRKESAKSQPELAELEAAAKNQKLGLHAGNNEEHIRKVVWTMESPKEFHEANKGKPLNAIIEHIRDGSTYRGFFLPSFQHFTIMLSGAKVSIKYFFRFLVLASVLVVYISIIIKCE